MTGRPHRSRFRRVLPLAAVALTAAGGCGAPPQAEPLDTATVVRSIDIVFRPGDDDRIVVVEAGTDRVLRTLEAGEGGFLRGALRPLRRERERHDVPLTAPYILELHADGTLYLRDPPTELHLDVAAFGPTSRAQFMTLLDGRDPPAHPTLSNPNGPMEDRP